MEQAWIFFQWLGIYYGPYTDAKDAEASLQKKGFKRLGDFIWEFTSPDKVPVQVEICLRDFASTTAIADQPRTIVREREERVAAVG